MKQGSILGIQASWGSGLVFLVVETKEGIESIPCEHNTTFKALDNCFGNVALKDKQISFETDAFGVLEYFEPLEVVE